MALRFTSLDSFLRNHSAVFVEKSIPAVSDVAAFASVARAVDFYLDGADLAEGVADATDLGGV